MESNVEESRNSSAEIGHLSRPLEGGEQGRHGIRDACAEIVPFYEMDGTGHRWARKARPARQEPVTRGVTMGSDGRPKLAPYSRRARKCSPLFSLKYRLTERQVEMLAALARHRAL